MEILQFKTDVLPIRDKLFRIALRMLCNEDDAEDAVQEAMLKLWTMRYRLKEYKSIEGLAVQILKNDCINTIKKHRFQSEEVLFSFQDSTLLPCESLENRDAAEMVIQIIGQLPELQRLSIQLKDIEGLELKEIAEITGSEEGAVRTNLSRARKKVREIFFKINQFSIE